MSALRIGRGFNFTQVIPILKSLGLFSSAKFVQQRIVHLLLLVKFGNDYVIRLVCIVQSSFNPRLKFIDVWDSQLRDRFLAGIGNTALNTTSLLRWWYNVDCLEDYDERRPLCTISSIQQLRQSFRSLLESRHKNAHGHRPRCMSFGVVADKTAHRRQDHHHHRLSHNHTRCVWCLWNRGGCNGSCHHSCHRKIMASCTEIIKISFEGKPPRGVCR